MGPVVQTTLGVFTKEVDLKAVIEALEHLLPNLTEADVPVRLSGWMLVEHIHNPETIMHRGEVFASADFAPARDAARGSVGDVGIGPVGIAVPFPSGM